MKKLLAVTATALACAHTPPAVTSERLPYPPARRDATADVLFGEKVEDPYRWVEDEKSPEVQAFMTAQDGFARERLAKLPGREALAKRFTELLYIDQFGIPVQRGQRLFYARQRADQNKAILYWRDGDGPEHVLLDPNTWENGTVSLGDWQPSWDGKKVAFAQHPNNADDAVMHVVDVDSGKWSDADVLEGARYASASWTPDNRGFYYVWLPMDRSISEADRPGWQQVRFHALGTAQEKDPTLYGPLKNASLFLGPSLSRDGKYLFMTISNGWTSNSVYWLRPGVEKTFRPLIESKDAHYEVEEWRGKLYIKTDEGAPNGRVFVADPAKPERANWHELIPEDKKAAIQSLSIVGEKLGVEALRNASSELTLYSLEGKKLSTVQLPTLGSTSGLVGLEEAPVAYFSFSSFTFPREVRKVDLATGQSTTWAQAKLPIDPNQFEVKQVWYPSKDGTQVSMFLVHRKDVTPTGAVPTLLYGYGGFDISMTPDFRASIYPFIERGGLYALANLRGGGEYGEAWHQAGMLGKKQNVFDDFETAADWLEHSGWTKAEKLAIQGGSNGGLLVGAAITQRPELYRAAVCQVPLLDMVRYTKVGAGMTWSSEYGNPDTEADFKTLFAYSPYHHVREGVAYPAVLFMSSDHDDRVDPMHARKLAAALQHASAGGPVLLRIERHAGHGGADRIDQTVNSLADMYSFLFEQLGVPVPSSAR